MNYLLEDFSCSLPTAAVPRLPLRAEAAARPAMKIGAKRILKVGVGSVGKLFEACVERFEGNFA